MSREKHKLAVVIGPPSNRKRQEVALFKECPNFETTMVLSSVEKSWIEEGEDYACAKLVKLMPDFLAGFAVRKPYSPVSFVKLADLEKCLEDVDVINCIELYSFISRQCAKIAREKGKKLVVSVFETIPSFSLHKSPPFHRNVKDVLRQADVFVAYTNRSAEYLRQLEAPEEKIRVNYPGVDLQRFHPSKESNHGNVRIIFVGGFTGEKGLTILLKAFSRINAETNEVELWVCTKPRNKREGTLIQAYAQKYPVKMFGDVDFDKMPEMYRQCDIFCLPSYDKKKWGMRVWEEQFGFALVEAMACGLPVVATDCGVIPEIVNPGNIIVSQKSVDALYSGLCDMLEDERRRKNLGRKNRAMAMQLFDIEKQKIKINQVLSGLFQK